MASKRRDWGRIRQLKSGRWQARYPGPDGVLRPAPETFETRKAAAGWLAEKQTEIEKEDWVDPDAGKVPFMGYASKWVAERKLSETTRERYEGIVRNHFGPTFEGKKVADIKAATVRRWRSDLTNAGVGAPTVAKSYRLLRAIFNTAVNEDRMVKRNPCNIKGAGDDDSPERSVLNIRQVFAIADAVPPRYRVLVLLATFTSLRFGELAALRRRDVDLTTGEVRVRRSQAELRGGAVIKGPKSAAGKRTVAIPSVIVEDLRQHLEHNAEAGADGIVFIGPQGGILRRRNFRRLWSKARASAGVDGDVHFHDLRHTGNQLAAEGGATTKELMARMGHSTSRAALIYQHATRERDRAIADAISRNVDAARKPEGKRARKRAKSHRKGHAGGTQGGKAA
ncbi:tyrosine-type recombinase/integrase [Amycolatopsis sp. NPDC102389]|uniref:tyrosine-type recombinase/integrase n=1 Tax=Amycolatopsis sp. NPDC102389 TaxID=3363941 RepID=UPI0038174E18